MHSVLLLHSLTSPTILHLHDKRFKTLQNYSLRLPFHYCDFKSFIIVPWGSLEEKCVLDILIRFSNTQTGLSRGLVLRHFKAPCVSQKHISQNDCLIFCWEQLLLLETAICTHFFKVPLKFLLTEHTNQFAPLGFLATCAYSTCRALHSYHICSCSPDNSHKPFCQTALAKTSQAQQCSAETIDLMGTADIPYIDLPLANTQEVSWTPPAQRGSWVCSSKPTMNTSRRGEKRKKKPSGGRAHSNLLARNLTQGWVEAFLSRWNSHTHKFLKGTNRKGNLFSCGEQR